MKMAKFLVPHFDAGAVKFQAGEAYQLTDETSLCITRGAAVEVDVEDEPAAVAADEAKTAETETPPTDAKPAAKAKK